MRLELFLTSYTKKPPQNRFADQNERPEPTQLLEENMGGTLFDINCSKIFLDQSPKAKEVKANVNKQNLIKLKSLCTAKETTNKMKTQPREWERVFANNVTDKGLISKI